MLQEYSWLAQISSSVVFIVLLWVYARRYLVSASPLTSGLEQFGMSIIIGSALGNLSERFVYGHVTDFLEFAFIKFPVFNLADVLIDTGVALILISVYCLRKNIAKKEDDRNIRQCKPNYH
jgi:signal peptidase II